MDLEVEYDYHHVYPEVYRSTAIFYLQVPQCMRHNPSRSSQVAGDKPAGRTCNRIRKSRAQNPDVLNMSGQPQAHKSGPSTGVGPPAPVPAPAQSLVAAGKLIRRVLMVPTTTVSSVPSSSSFVPILLSERNSPLGDKREGEKGNVLYGTIRGASPAGSLWLRQREQERASSMHGWEPESELKANIKDRHLNPLRNSRNRLAIEKSYDSNEQVELPESERRRRSAEWKIFHAKKIS